MVNACEEFVRSVVELMGDNCPAQYRVLADHGRVFTATARPHTVDRMGECFRNALLLVATDPQRYTYCEGYAQPEGLIPLAHAWVITSDGTVIDPTWRFNSNTQYFGVPLMYDWVMDFATSTRYYGVFPNLSRYEHGNVLPHLLLGIAPQSIAKEF